MPTLPPERAPLPGHEPHQHRQMAESFGADAERYDRARPRYPDALVDRIVAGQPRARRPRRRLRHRHRRPAVPGGRLHGARRRARRADGRLRAPAPGLEVEVATFEAWDPAGRRFDAVVAGQAWHWVDPVAGAAKAARGAAARRPAGRVLERLPASARRGGSLRRGLPAGRARLAVRPPAMTEAGPGRRTRRCSPRPPTGSGRRAGSATRSSGGSTGSGPTPATSGWTSCPPTAHSPGSRRPKLAEVLEGVGAAIDAMGGSFTMPYATVAVTATRTAA